MEIMDIRNGVGLKYVGKLRASPRSSHSFLCLVQKRRNKGVWPDKNLAGRQNLQYYRLHVWVEYFGLCPFVGNIKLLLLLSYQPMKNLFSFFFLLGKLKNTRGKGKRNKKGGGEDPSYRVE